METLALFAKPSTLADTYELGTAQSVGVELAGIAPNGILEDSYAVQDATGRVYYIVHVQFGGGCATSSMVSLELKVASLKFGPL